MADLKLFHNLLTTPVLNWPQLTTLLFF